MPEIIHPDVHLNGTAPSELLELRLNARFQLGKLQEALQQMAPNGRDYYHTPGALKLAVEQHDRRRKSLDALLAELTVEIDVLVEKIDARENQ